MLLDADLVSVAIQMYQGQLLHRLKSCIDTFSYKFKETDPETGTEREISFSVKEKRIVFYNPKLAKDTPIPRVPFF